MEKQTKIKLFGILGFYTTLSFVLAIGIKISNPELEFTNCFINSLILVWGAYFILTLLFGFLRMMCGE